MQGSTEATSEEIGRARELGMMIEDESFKDKRRNGDGLKQEKDERQRGRVRFISSGRRYRREGDCQVTRTSDCQVTRTSDTEGTTKPELVTPGKEELRND